MPASDCNTWGVITVFCNVGTGKIDGRGRFLWVLKSFSSIRTLR